MRMVSYAQNFEDVMLWRALSFVTSGHYIDIGAHDPRVDSVSRLFYERGWRGVHVDPVEEFCQALRIDRPDEVTIQAAVAAKSGAARLFQLHGLSTINADVAEKHQRQGFQPFEVVVPTIPLEQILDDSNREIHWLKIDVEGAEQEVLRSWGAAQARPWIVVVESTWPLTQDARHQEWEEELLSRGYAFAYFDGLNRFYIAEGKRALLRSFATPPNVFDDFILSGLSSAPFCQIDGHISYANINYLLGRFHAHSSQIVGLSAELQKLKEVGAREKLTRRLLRLRLAEASRLAKHQKAERAKLKVELERGQTQLKTVEGKLNATFELAEFWKSKAEREVGRGGAVLAMIAERVECLAAMTPSDATTPILPFCLAEDLDTQDALFADSLPQAALSIAKSLELLRLRHQAGWKTEILLMDALKEERQHSADLVRQVGEMNAATGRMLHSLEFARSNEVAAREELSASSSRAVQLESTLLNFIRKSRVWSQEFAKPQREFSDLVSPLVVETISDEIEGHFQRIEAVERELRGQLAEQRIQLERMNNRVWGRFRRVVAGWVGMRSSSPEQSQMQVTTPPSAGAAYESKRLVSGEGMRNVSIEEVLELNDVDFLWKAYRSILLRDPDPEGMQFYLRKLRSGVSKESVVFQLSSSKEGSRINAGVLGLDALVRRQTRRNSWISRLLTHRSRAIEGNINRLENLMARHHGAVLTRFERLEAELSMLRNHVTASGVQTANAPRRDDGEGRFRSQGESILSAFSLNAKEDDGNLLQALNTAVNTSIEARQIAQASKRK